jgi:hypothetical protein
MKLTQINFNYRHFANLMGDCAVEPKKLLKTFYFHCLTHFMIIVTRRLKAETVEAERILHRNYKRLT